MTEYTCFKCATLIVAAEPPEVCPTCGDDTEIRETCPMCGAIIDEDTKVCPECREAVA